MPWQLRWTGRAASMPPSPSSAPAPPPLSALMEPPTRLPGFGKRWAGFQGGATAGLWPGVSESGPYSSAVGGWVGSGSAGTPQGAISAGKHFCGDLGMPVGAVSCQTLGNSAGSFPGLPPLVFANFPGNLTLRCEARTLGKHGHSPLTCPQSWRGGWPIKMRGWPLPVQFRG